jgi:hypothetical protein
LIVISGMAFLSFAWLISFGCTSGLTPNPVCKPCRGPTHLDLPEAPIDVQLNARDIGRRTAGQGQGCLRYFLRPTEALHKEPETRSRSYLCVQPFEPTSSYWRVGAGELQAGRDLSLSISAAFRSVCIHGRKPKGGQIGGKRRLKTMTSSRPREDQTRDQVHLRHFANPGRLHTLRRWG